MARTASNKKRTARPPHKPLKPSPLSPHPPTYIAISSNLTNYNPQPGDDAPECIDMGVAVFRGEPPVWNDERADASLPPLLSQVECYHVINRKHCRVRADAGCDKDVLLKYPMLYMSLYARSEILDEEEMKNWLLTLLQESRKGGEGAATTWSYSKAVEARGEQFRLAHGSAYSTRAAIHDEELLESGEDRNLVVMDWAAPGTDRLLQSWGIVDKLRIKDDERVQFWDLRQWDRMAQLAPNPCSEPRDFTAALKALGIGHCIETDPYGLRNRDIRGNAGNDAYLKVAIFLSFFTMTCEEQAALMVTGRPLSRSSLSPVDLERDTEILEANQRLDWEIHPQAEFEPYKPVPADRVEAKREQRPKIERPVETRPKRMTIWDLPPATSQGTKAGDKGTDGSRVGGSRDAKSGMGRPTHNGYGTTGASEKVKATPLDWLRGGKRDKLQTVYE
ncbi:hypothetical protein PG993_009201 [Apiospora rasikravindrae]|uniref:Uncharacterized protein n=1 Tax=Apiospora rasikravindrae TaxID=990691 RepID=A0ABR1SK19_9PEZI